MVTYFIKITQVILTVVLWIYATSTNFYIAPTSITGRTVYSHQCVCMSFVCLYACISQKPHVQIS